MQILDIKPCIFSARVPKMNSQKRVVFCANSFGPDVFEKIKEDNERVREEKVVLECKISEKPEFQKSFVLNSCATKMVEYSDSIEQLSLVKFVFDEESFHSGTKMPSLFGVIRAATSPSRIEIVKKVFSNESLYQNDVLLGKLEKVLYSVNNASEQYAFQPKMDVLDKVLGSEKLYENEGFVNCLGTLLYDTFNDVEGRKNVTVLDAVLNNNELSNNEEFIQAIGNVLIKNEIDSSSFSEKQNVILRAVSNVGDARSAEVFRNIVVDEELFNDENVINYLPEIVNNVSFESSRRIDTLITYLQDENINKTPSYCKTFITEFMHPACDSLQKAEMMTRVKEQAYKKKLQLQAGNEVLDEKKIDAFFAENHPALVSALEILGERNFVHSYRLKKAGVKELCLDCNYIKEILGDNEYYEKLLLKTNPHASKQYIELQNQINELKGSYKFVKALGDDFKLKMLQNQIGSLSKQSRDLLANKVDADPDTVINKVSVIANSLEKYDANSQRTKLKEFIDLFDNSTPENDRAWQKAVCEEVFARMEEPYDEKIATQFGLAESKYVGKLLGAHFQVVADLKELVQEVRKNPDKSLFEIFEMLPSNKITREKFKENGLDYDKWVGFDDSFALVVKKSNNDEDGDVVIRKVDMNNLTKALFLGNEAACCTAIGTGICHAMAMGYVKNKFIGAIELLDNEKPVGNTMCYFGKVDGELSLILDNIHIKPEYRKCDDIRDGIIKYAQDICAEVGQPNIPVYVSGHRNKVDLSAFESEYYVLEPIGDSGSDEIYWDCSTDYERIAPGKTFHSELTRVV